jgi:hypothetical protein
MALQATPAARQQGPNTHQLFNRETVFSTLSVRQLHDAMIGELLEAVFSMWSAPRLYHSIDRVQPSAVQLSTVEWSELVG